MYELRQLLNEGNPAEAIVNVACDFLRDLADRRATVGTIGKQLYSICISPDRNVPVQCGYHVSAAQRATFMPSQIYALSESTGYVTNIQVKPVEADTPPISVPKISKNAPCSCGSRVRYKNCHGKRLGPARD